MKHNAEVEYFLGIKRIFESTRCQSRFSIAGEYTNYLELPRPFIFFPSVYHYWHGIGQAREYRGTYWHVYWMTGERSWINRESLKIINW